MKWDLGTEPDWLRDIFGVLFNEGYGMTAGKGTDKDVGVCGIFAFVGIKYRDGGDKFQAEMSGTLHIRFLVRFGLWMLF